jgi:type II secretory pathway pseudopilin PulG
MLSKVPSRKRHNQQGYVLLAILFALTLLVISLAVAAPIVAKAVQRTKEQELIRRGDQYALAIRRFYKKFGRYPSDIDQLENTNNIRFLRRKYLDPITGKDDWQPIQFGQARPALGFFGQKVVTTGGLSPSGPGIGPSSIGTGQSGSGASSNGTGFGASGSSASTANPNASGSSQPSGTENASAGKSGNSSNAGPAGSASNPFSSDQLSGKTFGGGAIVGVSIPSQKESLKEFQQKNHYNEWQFVYDPTMDPTLRGGAGTGAATGIPGGINQPGLNQPGLNQPGLNPTSPNSPSQPNSTGTGTGATNPNPSVPR